MTTAEARRAIAVNDDAGDFGESRLNREKAGGSIASFAFEIRERHGVAFDEGPNARAAQLRDVAITAQQSSHIPGDGAHIRPFAAFSLENGRLGRTAHHPQLVDRDFTGLKFDLFSVAREIVSAFSIHLDRREGGRRLHDGADETGSTAATASSVGDPPTFSSPVRPSRRCQSQFPSAR